MSDEKPKMDVDRFLKNLAAQRDRYEKMVAVTDRQNQAIAASDIDELLTILKKKGELLSEIDEIEKQAAPDREAWEAARETLDAATVKSVEQGVNETRNILQKLLKLEEEGKTMMEKQKGTTTKELLQLRQKKKARNAYGEQKPPDESRFFDSNQ